MSAHAPAVTDFELNGRSVRAQVGESVLDVARREGVAIPHLCCTQKLGAVGNCRSCMVEIEGERVLAPSCCRVPQAGMKVSTDSPRARRAQRVVLELMACDMPRTPAVAPNSANPSTAGDGRPTHDELAYWSTQMGVEGSRFAPRERIATDHSHPAIAVNLDACIQCTRCVRACREVQVNDVIGLAWRGERARIVFDLGDELGASLCVACGECVQACPTGALSSVAAVDPAPQRSVDTLCPYCGVGCQLTYRIGGQRILSAQGRDGPANHGRLCVKGRYGFDYVGHAQRLTRPLIRRAGAPKDGSALLDPARWQEVFREADWDEALDLAGGTLAGIRDAHGARALAGFGCAKGSNEEAYLFQKLVRTGFGSNNVDHCTRLCHASSVAALLEGIGSGAVSNPVMDVTRAEVVLLVGANPTVNHPVAATWLKNAIRQGTRLIVCDPRRSDLARLAHRHLAFHPDTDVALLNAMMHVIVTEGLVDADFIAHRTEGYEALRSHLEGFAPEVMSAICGIDAASIREVARLFATSRASMILWGMGVSQHVHGTDNARCLIALSLITGQIGRPGTGLHPLRGQNNVQGASDAGLIPMMLPDYQPVSDEAVRRRFEQAWDLPTGKLDAQPGLTVVEIMNAISSGGIRGLYVMGENPAMSDPDAHHARAALASLEHLVVQDIFLTETAALADVVLPASACAEKTGTFTNTDRCVQLGRQALEPPGEARQDLWIITQMARRLGLDWRYGQVKDVFQEMRQLMPSIGGIGWDRLEREHAVTYPCVAEGDPGESVMFADVFPRPGGRARLVPASLVAADELPDTHYPFILITGRQLEHWHTGSMTRRAAVLDALEPEAVALLHPADLAAIGAVAGEPLTLQSRRGQVTMFARSDDGAARGTVFVPFCYREAAVNLLTNAALDPIAKIPEFKYCAVKVLPGGDRSVA